MRLLVIGGGGREHALIWKLSASPRVQKIFCVPGNGGIVALAECRPDLPIDRSLIDWALRERIDLAVIGPEAPLTAGLADDFSAAGIAVFGPSAAAARLEGSKSHAKEIMAAAGVPTAGARSFTNYQAASEYLRALKAPYVVKADGLAAGKGVVVAENIRDAERAAADCLKSDMFGEAGRTIVIEEFLAGPEVSLLAFVDGKNIKFMPPAQDYKRVGDGDTGPNTGGMGAYAPVPFLNEGALAEIVKTVFYPTVQALADRGIVYQGVLYAGLVITDAGPKVLEFNVRFGDPETEALLLLLESDLVDVMSACAEGRLDQVEIRWSDQKAITLVLASAGYPLSPVTGREIDGLTAAAQTDVVIFHAGTALADGALVTAGGRVLNISAVGQDFAAAREKVYGAAETIQFAGKQFRRDIGAF